MSVCSFLPSTPSFQHQCWQQRDPVCFFYIDLTITFMKFAKYFFCVSTQVFTITFMKWKKCSFFGWFSLLVWDCDILKRDFCHIFCFCHILICFLHIWHLKWWWWWLIGRYLRLRLWYLGARSFLSYIWLRPILIDSFLTLAFICFLHIWLLKCWLWWWLGHIKGWCFVISSILPHFLPLFLHISFNTRWW